MDVNLECLPAIIYLFGQMSQRFFVNETKRNPQYWPSPGIRDVPLTALFGSVSAVMVKATEMN